MKAQERVLSDVAEFRLLEHVVRTMPTKRKSASCIVTDELSLDLITRHIADAGRSVGREPPPVLLTDALAKRVSGGRRPPLVVVASLGDEQNLYDEVYARCPGYDRERIFRLWRDLFTNKVARLYTKASPDATEFYVHPSPVLRSEVEGLKAYAIVCTPRTGSTMLMHMLKKLGYCGAPREHLRNGVLSLVEFCGFDFQWWLDAVLVNEASDGKIFGTKLISHFLFRAEELAERGPLTLSGAERIDWRIVRLRRRDTIAQAVSLYVAQESGVFFERDTQKRRRREEFLESLDYDYDAIETHHRDVLAQESGLDRLLARRSFATIEVEYEALLHDPTGELTRVLSFLGFAPSADFAAPIPESKKLDDRLSAPLYARFRADYIQGTSPPSAR
jgi:LPS sulfotransferase NodH